MDQWEHWESYLEYEQTCFHPLVSGDSHWAPAESAWPCCWRHLEADAPTRCSSSTVPGPGDKRCILMLKMKLLYTNLDFSSTVDEVKSRCITASMSVTCKFLRPFNVDKLSVDKKLLSRTSISRETSGPNVPAGMVLRLEPRYTITSRNIQYIARIIITVIILFVLY